MNVKSWVLVCLAVGLAVAIGGETEAQSPARGKMPTPGKKAAPSKVDAERARISRIVKNFDPNKIADKRSVKSVKARIAELEVMEAEAERLRVLGIGLPAEKLPRERVKHLEAYLYWLEERAYPNDTIDQDAMTKALQHRASMMSKRPPLDPTQLKEPDEGTGDSPTGFWNFIGPRNLEPRDREFFGPKPVAGRVAGIAISHQNPTSTWYVASGQGGVFKTTNGGATYTAISTSFDTQCIGDLAVDPNNENIIYAATGDFDWGTPYNDGIYKSTNGGTTWTRYSLGAGVSTLVSEMVIDPENSNILYVSTGRGSPEDHGIYRSSNGGATWTLVESSVSSFYGISIGVRESGVRYIWAVSGTSIFRSSNGTTWTTTSVPGGFGLSGDIAASMVDRDTVYLLGSEATNIWKSTNAGGSWASTLNNFQNGTAGEPLYNWSQPTYDFYIETGKTSGNADIVVVGLIDIQVSRNGGTTWSSIGGPTWSSLNAMTHNDQHSFCLRPDDNNSFLFGNDGGLYGATWFVGLNSYVISNYNELLPFTSFYTFDAHPTNSSIVLGGTQDNGTPYSNGMLNDWLSATSADGSGCAMSDADPLKQYASIQRYGWNPITREFGIARTTTGWVTRSTTSTFGIPGETRPLFIPPMADDNLLNPAVYVGTDYLYRYKEGIGWNNRLGGFQFPHQVRSIAVAPSDPNVLYVGTITGMVFRSANGGSTWTRIDVGATSLPSRAVTCISVSPTSPQVILVTLSGSGENVWRCLNANAAPATISWQSRSGSGATALPSAPMNWIERDPWNSSSELYVASDLGVFYSDDAGSSWYSMDNDFGLPAMRVDRLVAQPGSQRLHAATWGRGAYRMAITSNAPALTGFAFTSASVVGGFSRGGTVTLSQIAPPGGVQVAMSSTSSIFNGPTTVTVPAGQSATTGTFFFDVIATTTTISVTATLGSNSFSDTIQVISHELVSMVVPATIKGGDNALGTLNLNNDAPSGGLQVPITSSAPSIASVPTTVTFVSGNSNGVFTIDTNSISGATNFSVAISSSWHGGNVSDVTQITPVNVTGMTTPTEIVGGFSDIGAAFLSTTAPLDGIVLPLTSNNTSVLTVPASVTVAQGASTAFFAINTSLTRADRVVTVSTTRGGTTVQDTTLVKKIGLSSMTLTPNTVRENARFSVTATIDTAAPPGGVNVTFSSNNSRLVRFSPTVLTIPAGATSATATIGRTFTLGTAAVGGGTNVVVTARFLDETRTATLRVQGIRP